MASQNTPTSLRKLITLVTVLLFALAAPLQAAPPSGKKGGGGGSGGGSTAVPEQHHLWRVQLNGPYSNVRPVVAADGTIYVVDVHDFLYAIGADGEIRWVVAEAGSKGVDLGPDGTVYTGNENWIKAFNSDGSLKWSFTQTPRAFLMQDVAVGPDGHLYALASSGMGVFSLQDLGDHAQLRWTNPEIYGRPFTGYVELEFGPTQDGRDQQLYFYANGHTRAVRLSDGASVFTVGGGNTNPRVSLVDGSWHRPATALTPDASLVWEFDFPLATGTTEPTLDGNGNHYAVNSGRILYAIDSFGRELWTSDLGEYAGLPDISPQNDLSILAVGGPGQPAGLLSVSTGNGSRRWRMEFPDDGSGYDQFVDSAIAFSQDGTRAYVTTAVAAAGQSYLNAINTDPSIPSASTLLRSADITIGAKSGRRSVNFTAQIQVVDENRAGLSGVEVFAYWTLPDGTAKAQTATSSGSGIAKFSLSGPGGLYRIDVTDMQREGYTFDPRHGVLQAGKAWY